MTKFVAHGDYKLWLDGNVFCADLHGLWNREAAEQFCQDFMRLAKEIKGPWGHVVYLNDWELCTEDVFAVVQNLVDWCINNELLRAANVYSPSTMKSIFINSMVVEQKGLFQRAVFDNEEAALTWLKSEGFPTTGAKVSVIEFGTYSES